MAHAARISHPSVPVISVGNFTFGATGKTPCVMFLTDLALRHSQGSGKSGERGYPSKKVPMLLSRVCVARNGTMMDVRPIVQTNEGGHCC